MIQPKLSDIKGFRVLAHAFTAGVESCYVVPEFGAVFDIGRCPDAALMQTRLFLTHGHIDHAAGLPYWFAMNALSGGPPRSAYVPKDALGDFDALLSAHQHLGSKMSRRDGERLLFPQTGGERIQLSNHLSVVPFKVQHGVPSLGYAVVREVSKLLSAYLGRTPEEIGLAVQNGEVVSAKVERVEFVYTGDTRATIVESNGFVRQARVLLMECTYVGKEVTSESAFDWGHTHLDDLAARADLFENGFIVLTHFSKRHSYDDVLAEVARLPQRFRERIVLLHWEKPTAA